MERSDNINGAGLMVVRIRPQIGRAVAEIKGIVFALGEPVANRRIHRGVATCPSVKRNPVSAFAGQSGIRRTVVQRVHPFQLGALDHIRIESNVVHARKLHCQIADGCRPFAAAGSDYSANLEGARKTRRPRLEIGLVSQDPPCSVPVLVADFDYAVRMRFPDGVGMNNGKRGLVVVLERKRRAGALRRGVRRRCNGKVRRRAVRVQAERIEFSGDEGERPSPGRPKRNAESSNDERSGGADGNGAVQGDRNGLRAGRSVRRPERVGRP